MSAYFAFIGLDGAGKSTLADIVEGCTSVHKHREDCYYRQNTLEVPGRYVENHWMHNVILMLLQNQAHAFVLLLDGETRLSYYSSGFARATRKPSLAVVTKADVLNEAQRKEAQALLADTGCQDLLFLSTKTGEGICEFKQWVAKQKQDVQLTMKQSGNERRQPCII
ncbi:EutP/PduV family microcompartment system protein [Atopobium fossor]|uniref:EutP/PduV family microcompartment system protein n=1 Tax=Atopobium fossor TaxID=39487 RepID=UPI000410D541|nr:EutP/PduV family microcompartment system protein [Atopobium fossor]